MARQGQVAQFRLELLGFHKGWQITNDSVYYILAPRGHYFDVSLQNVLECLYLTDAQPVHCVFACLFSKELRAPHDVLFSLSYPRTSPVRLTGLREISPTMLRAV